LLHELRKHLYTQAPVHFIKTIAVT